MVNELVSCRRCCWWAAGEATEREAITRTIRHHQPMKNLSSEKHSTLDMCAFPGLFPFAAPSTYTVEWDGTSSNNRFEIDLYYCGSYCMSVSFTLQTRSGKGERASEKARARAHSFLLAFFWRPLSLTS